VRHLWKEYYIETNAIVFVVDSADRSRLDEAKEVIQIQKIFIPNSLRT
jgi:GTPase SAR1 family protein